MRLILITSILFNCAGILAQINDDFEGFKLIEIRKFKGSIIYSVSHMSSGEFLYKKVEWDDSLLKERIIDSLTISRSNDIQEIFDKLNTGAERMGLVFKHVPSYDINFKLTYSKNEKNLEYYGSKKRCTEGKVSDERRCKQILKQKRRLVNRALRIAKH